jgi:hypothetical protein
MVQPEDVKALWSGFANVSDADIAAQIKAAETEVDAYLAMQGIDLTAEDAPWSLDDRDYAITRLAAHYTAQVHGLLPESYSIAGISESFGRSARSDLMQTIFGQQYLKFLKLKGGASLPLARTG